MGKSTNNSLYATCGACGWVGKESELPPDPEHLCGKDECPECEVEGNITCCYQSYEDAKAKICEHQIGLNEKCEECEAIGNTENRTYFSWGY